MAIAEPIREKSGSTGPIRGELYSPERLEQFAEILASEHEVLPGRRRGRPLLARLSDNSRFLLASYREIADALREPGSLTPASEWLVDNFHTVEDQIREIREDLPPSFYAELPKLAGGPHAGEPRVYAVAEAFIEHTDSRFDTETCRRYLRAYQRKRPLTIGELWAVAISLRLVLVENLRRIVEAMDRRRRARDEADSLADALLRRGDDARTTALRLDQLDAAPTRREFVVQLLSRLRDQDPSVTPALVRLHRRLAAMGTNAEDIVRLEHQAQIGMHVTVRNVITSMRLLSAVDWMEFFESVSLVEDALREGTRVAEMDFGTRDQYRRAVEEISRGTSLSEIEIALRARERARTMAAEAAPARLADPGYYLIGRGRRAFERDVGYRARPSQWLRRAWVRAAPFSYPLTLLVVTALVGAIPIVVAYAAGAPVLTLWLLGLPSLVLASDVAIAIVNRDVTDRIGPRRLPRLALDGIPAACRSLVAVPILLTSEAEIQEVVERLEVHYLGNGEGDVTFALLSDWVDAEREVDPQDEALLAAAAGAIRALNEKHGAGPDGVPRFLLLHRGRRWNPREGVWMGWERKRGKLHEMNRLLRGARDTSFIPVAAGGVVVPEGVQYVLTLDADTRLQRGDVARMVGAMAHPLNEPVFDDRTNMVAEGHALLQPLVTPTLPLSGSGTLYQRIFSGPRGIDPYAFAVSDVYQDLFGEGIYTGKGIYAVDAFERALAGRIPENALLSHDLFEGIFARAGLLSDVGLYEEYPGHYEAAAARQHRWIRGDWQLLPWLLPRAPDAEGRRVPNPIGGIGRWKILDNLRRSLSAPAAVAILLGGWVLPGADARLWLGFVLATLALPGALPLLGEIVPARRGIAKRSFVGGLASDVVIWVSQVALRLCLLAHQAWLAGDAILRTLGRLLFTRRRMLEWVPAAAARQVLDLKRSGFYRRMHGALVIAGVAAVLVVLIRPSSWMHALAFTAAWALSPLVARWISLPSDVDEGRPLSSAGAAQLRFVARLTWRYFETFVGAEDGFLPPDNFQESPRAEIAHRTSPTNIGLALLSTAAAADFGWIGTMEMADRLENVFRTLGKLERFRGHYFNWYETRSGRPLEPRYVSTVDSGNLVGHAVALHQACLDRLEVALPFRLVLAGVADALAPLAECALRLAQGKREGAVTKRQLETVLSEMASLVSTIPRTAADWITRWRALSTRGGALADTIHALVIEAAGADVQDAVDWAQSLQRTIASHRRDAEALWGWAAVAASSLPPEAAVIVEELGSADVTLGTAPERFEFAARRLRQLDGESKTPAVDAVADQIENSARVADALIRQLTALGRSALDIAAETDFRFLFDEERQLFSIGYRLSDGRLDTGYYDLLASEARLASFIAIARGDVPTSHWFRLGRPLTPVGSGSALVSWSGSMFEYLMPDLVLDVPTGSLLDQTERLVVRRQIGYGEEHGIPWGISESAYNARDLDFTYQYSNFGVSGLGLKRGLSEDLVVAPYATALAAMVDPQAAAANFERLAAIGARGRYGFYEAIDYTRSRLPEGSGQVLVRTFMAHHQGMTIVAIANALMEGIMRQRLHADPAVQATELLLQERTPRSVAVARPRADEVHASAHVRDFIPPVLRRFRSPHDPTPRTHLLSNGRYSVMVTAAGSGYSRWKTLDVTRWREDVTRDPWGAYFFLRDVQSGKTWSAGYQPSGVEAEEYEAIYSEDRVAIHRRDGPFATSLEIVVSPEDDAEIRQVSVTNFGLRAREVEITSFAELVLAPGGADAAHPAFSKLFVETEFVPSLEALVATRRRREPEEEPIWVAHVAPVDGETLGAVQYEADRARFIGRGRTPRRALAMEEGRPLSNSVGPVLDPIFALRRRVRVRPGQTVRVHFATVAAASREAIITLADKYRNTATFERTVTLAWTHAQVQLQHLGISPDEAHLFQRIATRILYLDPTLRAPADVLLRNRKGVSALWRHGISGDAPIVLVRIDHLEDQEIVRQLLRAHEYWLGKGLAADLVIINEQPTSYDQDLRGALESLVRTRQRFAEEAKAPGAVFLLRGDLLSEEERDALKTAARIVLLSRQGTLHDQIVRLLQGARPVKPSLPVRAQAAPADAPPPQPELEFFNGLGGFAENGSEYVTILGERQWTPTPWANVVANPGFGFLVTESGGGYTWAGNSRLNQITPWSNDPITDPPGEAIFVSDLESGEVWGPTALPVRDDWPYVARHGQGYSHFSHDSRGIGLQLLQFVPVDDPVKISVLSIENRSSSDRSLSVTAYVEWALSRAREAGAPYVVTERDEQTGALFARNCWNEEFPAVAFADLAGRQAAWTCDRTEFLGRNGALDAPEALASGRPLSGRVGAGLDPCAALQTRVRLAPGGRAEVLFLLGEGLDAAAARRLVQRWRKESIASALEQARRQWSDVLGAVEISTPDRSMDIMVNRWLLYQALSCRLWARTAFYQAGGAYGFRDQLQDGMALCVARRDITREQILRAGARQFPEGDVQHWWHVPTGQGTRTRISDDRLWLPYAVQHYLEVTGETAILDESIPFLEGAPLSPEETERYFLPEVSERRASLFEHCARALDASLGVGIHGLPLMGAGDWNDGMNRVGAQGKGESVWLAWFLHTTLWEFAALAERRGETARAERWRGHVRRLKAALETQGWDGDWYRRAFFDDGTPLGSSANDECRIDSIAQSWGVISGAAESERGRRGMEAVEQYLVRRGDGLVLLFTPPFDRGALDPGYIKGYPPGVRENGGQYTHGALWSVIAFAALGDGDKAAELFGILNPINHAATRAGLHRYKVEPYVAAADIYSEPPHVGRGGWTWYTGSGGWMYRAAVEWILGFRLREKSLHLDPCIPRAWPGFRISFRYHSARYELSVENPHGAMRGVSAVELDGIAVPGGAREIPLEDDGKTHHVRVVVGGTAPPP